MPWNHIKNRTGFTLVEIIAVLMLLGILAAVAIPKYLELQDESRRSASASAIAEVQARLAVGYGAELLQQNGATPAMSEILSEAGLTDATATTIGDFNLTPTISGNQVGIVINSIQDVTLDPTTAGTWTRPG